MKSILIAMGLVTGIWLLAPAEAAAQRWIPNSPYLPPYAQPGYGPGAPLPFLSPLPIYRTNYRMTGFYNPYTGVYVGRVFGFSPSSGYYTGYVNMYNTPYGTVYRYVPSFHSNDFFRTQAQSRQPGLGTIRPTY